jgi:hypothetical protein
LFSISVQPISLLHHILEILEPLDCRGAAVAEKYEGGILTPMSKSALNIDELNPEERLRMIEKLWDSLSGQPERVPLSDATRRAAPGIGSALGRP